MQDVEYKMITRAEALSDDKYFPTAYHIYMNLIWLNGEMGTGAGDVAGTADFGPTETGIGLVLDLERQLDAVKAEYKNLMDRDVPAYNKSIEGSGLAPLKTTGAPPASGKNRRPFRRIRVARASGPAHIPGYPFLARVVSISKTTILVLLICRCPRSASAQTGRFSHLTGPLPRTSPWLRHHEVRSPRIGRRGPSGIGLALSPVGASVDLGLIAAEESEGRKRDYALTAFGKRVLEAEARRLAGLVKLAPVRRLLREAKG